MFKTDRLGRFGGRRRSFVCGARVWLCLIHASIARGEDGPAVSGELFRVEGVRVLRVWGAPRERGFAHGYLLADDIVRLLDGYLKDSELTGGAEVYRERLPRIGQAFVIRPPYEEELRGISDGIAARLGEKAVVPSLGRKIGREDLLAINCIPDSARMGCSSFAAWGEMTSDGGTISGRNLDWHRIAALRGSELVVAYTPSPSDQAVAWVSITWPGFIGCLTGMNAGGVTVAMHDVRALPPSRRSGFTPRGLILREAIESATPVDGSPVAGIAAILRKRLCAVGNNVPVSFPSRGSAAASVVFEYDGVHSAGEGVTCVEPRSLFGVARPYQAATNHYRRRGVAVPCWRYDRIKRSLSASRRQPHSFDVDSAWAILRAVACSEANGRLETYQSVVFEPNKGLMHVAFSAGGKPAAECKPTTLNVAELLRPAH